MTDKTNKTDKIDKKEDRRVVRTRQLLRDSLMSLILERGYDNVTIQDITDRANLGRATFYLHYRDKDELLFKSLEAIYDDVVKSTDPFLGAHSTTPGLATFQHASAHKDLYRVMLGSQAAGAITRRIRDYMIGVAKQRIATQFPGTLSVPVEIVAQHVVGSLLALITWWIENDMPYSAEYMANTFQQLNLQALATQFQAD